MKMWSILPVLLLCCYPAGTSGNRVYVHPFTLFSPGKVTCKTLQPETTKTLETVAMESLDLAVLTPDARDAADQIRQNYTDKTAILAELVNSLGLRMYTALSAKQRSTNTIISLSNIYGSLLTLSLGASRKTAGNYQLLLGLNSGEDPEHCVSLVDGHKVLRTLRSITSPLLEGPKDEISTKVWAFSQQDTLLSEYFLQGMRHFSDVSFGRAVNFATPQEAQELVYRFVNRTSAGEEKAIFTDLSYATNFLFFSSFILKGTWKSARPIQSTPQEFHVGATTTIMAPMVTLRGMFYHRNDRARRCTMVRMSPNKFSYLLLVLPHEGVAISDFESKLLTEVLVSWYLNQRKEDMVVTVPKLSLSYTSDMRDILTNVSPEIDLMLLGSEARFSQMGTPQPFTVDKAYNEVMFEMSVDEDEPLLEQELTETPLEIAFNRPFLFFVVENQSNTILSMGKVTNPTL